MSVTKDSPEESPADVRRATSRLEVPRRRWFVPVEYIAEDHRDALPVGISDEPFLAAAFTHTEDR